MSSTVMALDQVDLSISENKIVGLFGPNGAGKSTLLKLLSRRSFEDQGEISIDGKILGKKTNISRVCLMSDYQELFNFLKIKTIFKIAQLSFSEWNETYKDKLVKIFDLNCNDIYSRLSKGQQGIVNTVVALASFAPITILDETFIALDSVNRKVLFDEILTLYNDTPRTFIIATHYINEISHMIEEVIILNKGKVLLHESKDHLETVAYTVTGPYDALNEVITSEEVLKDEKFGSLGQYSILVSSKDRLDHSIKPYVKDITITPLEELFVQIVQKEGVYERY